MQQWKGGLIKQYAKTCGQRVSTLFGVVVQMVSDEEQSLKKSKGKTTLFAQQ